MKSFYALSKAAFFLLFMAFSGPLSIQAQSFTLSGSEHTLVNGIYTLNGVNQLKQPRYTHTSGDYDLNYDGNGTWWLNTDKGLSGGTQYYKASGTSTEPPTTGWLNDKAQSAPLAWVADPKNGAIIAAKQAALDAEPQLIKGLGDNNPNQRFQVVQVPAVESTRLATAPSVLSANPVPEGVAATSYITNLRVSWYKIQSNDNDCSFAGENPDPRFSISTNYGYSTVIKGNDVTCDWHALNGDGRYFGPASYNNSIAVAPGSPFSMTLNINAWEEDGCGSDNTYNTCGLFGNDDDYPANTSHNLVLDPSTMYLGYNERVISWTGNDVTYSLTLSWELAFEDRLVTVYANTNQTGQIQQFGTGSYNSTYSSGSLTTGVGNDAISSMVIASGYKLTAYSSADLKGYPTVFRGTVNDVEGFNDKISSIKIEVDDNQPPAEGKTLLIYFNGSDAALDNQMLRNASRIKANQMVFVKGIGAANKNYSGGAINTGGFVYEEGEEIDQYSGFDVGNPFPTTFYSHSRVFKNTNDGTNAYSYFLGVDMDYDGSALAGYEDEDSYTAAANVLRILRRYNLRGYDTILISGHSRGAAVGIPSFLYGVKKAIESEAKFSGFLGIIGDVLGNSHSINVIALDPVAGSQILGMRNDYHMGSSFRMNEIYTWLKGRYTNINFSEIYANGGRMVDAWGVAGLTYTHTFEPSPNYLYDNPTNGVQRYWLGYRHSGMEDHTEKLYNLYDEAGVTVPLWLTTQIMNAALTNQPFFRDNKHWYNTFRRNDMDGWFSAFKFYCQPQSNLGLNPNAKDEILYYHSQRHKDFPNADGGQVNMNSFVGDNKLDFQCSRNYKPLTQAGTYTAGLPGLDGMLGSSTTDAEDWTNYCTCNGELLMSVKLVGSGALLHTQDISINLPYNVSANYHNAGQGFITAPTGAAVMANTWSAVATLHPTRPTAVRIYFAPDYFGKINQALVNNGRTPLTDTTQMWFYRATSGTVHTSIPNIPTADIYTNGPTASLTTWTLGRGDRAYYAEYLTNQFTGGGGGGGSQGTPLPIELLDFKGRNTEGGNLLTWQTATEKNVRDFDIERSLDGQLFIKIGTVKANGSNSNYTFTDPTTAANVHYYRLKINDLDGTTDYSKIITLSNSTKNQLKAYPSVTHQFLTVEAAEGAGFQVFNFLGQQVLTGKMSGQRLDVSALPQGTYVLKVGNEIAKFVKQ